jgi:hypothetical protein
MLRIEPLGTGLFLPAFVVGYELPYGADNDGANSALDRMPPDENLLVLDQQAGGYCMRYPSVAGAVLRLEANDGNGRRPFRDLVRGFRLMAEDPDLAALEAEFPTLRDLVYTVGDAYTTAQLHRIRSFVRRFVELPAVESGIEAFVRLEPCDALYYFGGWQVLSCGLGELARRRGAYLGEPSTCYRVEQGNVSDLVCTDSAVLDEELLARVTSLGAEIGRDGPPRVFLLWENSD